MIFNALNEPQRYNRKVIEIKLVLYDVKKSHNIYSTTFDPNVC